jgi:hypothetical protein
VIAARQQLACPDHANPALPPPGVPDGYVGLVALPGTGRVIFWTGKVGIGLRCPASSRPLMPGEGMAALQRALLLAA